MRRMGFVIVAMVAWAVTATGTVRHVPSEYPTIQAGIDAAVDGDTVLVADGTYTGDGNRDIDFTGKPILVTSENGPENCIIDCEGSEEDPHRGFYFQSGEDSASVVQGFTIKKGWVKGQSLQDLGGGILCYYSSPVIINNIITDNWAIYGGGIFCWNSISTILGNVIDSNACMGNGGGIRCYNSGLYIKENIIRRNGASSGGGIECAGWPSPRITNNLIYSNWAGWYGGGIACFYSDPQIDNNTITKNEATGNQESRGGGIASIMGSSPTMTNSILWGDSTSTGPEEIYVEEESSITVTYCDVEGGWPGEGNIDADPFFVTGPLGIYYLSQPPCQQDLSPCVDAGHPDSSVPEGTTKTCGACEDVWPVDMGYHYNCPAFPIYLLFDPYQEKVPREGTLDFEGIYTNFADTLIKAEVVFEAYLPGGTDPVRTFTDTKNIFPGRDTLYYALQVPLQAKKKAGYLFKGMIIVPPGSGEVVSEDSFEFEVKPAMESLPFGFEWVE
jgi:hypothetical protein